ncbi:MAG: hypothetical protein AB7O62_23475 [Pirellulales bacterium]
MKRWRFYTLAIVSLLALVIAPLVSSLPQANGWAEGDENMPAEEDVAVAPPPSIDPAFDMYVNIDLLLDAWSELNPSLMTDVALQLAAGERVLLRPHKLGSAADLMSLAARLAGKNNDEATLARLAKAADLIDSEEVAEQVEVATKLAGNSRADEPALTVSVATAEVEDIAFFSGAVEGIRAAELVGDIDAITDIQENVDSFEGLTDQQKEYLKTITGNAIESSGDVGETNTIAASLRKLSGDTRGGFYIGFPGGGGIGFGTGGRGHGGHVHGGGGHGGYGGRGHGGGGYGGRGHGGYGGGGYGGRGHGGYGGGGYGGRGHGGYGGGGYGGRGHGGYGGYTGHRVRWGHGGGWGHGGWSYP